MKDHEIYTVTVVRKMGIPISFTIRRRKLWFLLVIGLTIAGFLCFSAVSYPFLKSRVHRLHERLVQSEKKVAVLSQQIAKLDHDRYWKNEEIEVSERSAVKSNILEQPTFTTEGIWVTDRSTLTAAELELGTSVEVDRFDAELKGDELVLTMRLMNTSNPMEVIGGYLFVTLVNHNVSPPQYVSALKRGKLGENGYPASYKLGVQYLLKRRTSTKTIQFRLTEVNEYYTDAIVFLYSYKGRLVNRQVVDLDQSIFLE